MRFLYYTQLRFVPVEMTYKEKSLLNGLTLIVNKLQILFKNCIENETFHVITTSKVIPLTRHLDRSERSERSGEIS